MPRYRVEITGTVQGVGFRPFVYRLAQKLRLTGFVRNTAGGVAAEIEGGHENCLGFLEALKAEAPPLSSVADVAFEEIPPRGDASFEILPSAGGVRDTHIPPDVAVCADCRDEVLDPADRRYRYPFTNCTNCGPRFSVIRALPYDRKSTSMADFTMCPDCAAEYADPLSRRFHAQPDACPVCGPRLVLTREDGALAGDPVALFAEQIRAGKTVAVKGLGGFHLACDALNADAVRLLRRRKQRDSKPFALMVRDIAAAKALCVLSAEEERLLASPGAPVVLLRKRADCPAAEEAAPGHRRLGLMLPYTPLHCLLTQECPVLVMTSANLSGSPTLCADGDEKKLFSLADAVLTHDRAIVRRVDDSVAVVSGGRPRLLRRSRGFAPAPVRLPGNDRNILALGAQQNNAFCLAKGENAFVSGHIGDLDDPDAGRQLRSEVDAFIRLFDAPPDIVVCDPHPGYFTTALADAFRATVPVFKAQHHRAHFACVLAENAAREDAVGFIFDGTGLGDDGTVWGGELLYGGRGGITRAGHLLPFPLLGGEAAVREPWRCALSAAAAALGEEKALRLFPGREKEAAVLLEAGRKGVNAPRTSSMGRLFDAFAAIAGIKMSVSYEGQAAIELEQALDGGARGGYRFETAEKDGTLLFDWRQPIADAVADAGKGTPPGVISARFHRAVVGLLREAAGLMRERTGCGTAALSGGCFNNEFLFRAGKDALEKIGFRVLTNALVPPGDGGIAYGQAALAAWSV